MTYRSRLWAGVAALTMLAIAAWWMWPTSSTPISAQPAKDPLSMTEAQAGRMGIMLANARAEPSMPMATVTGTVVLPPSARAAVAVPFAGIVQQILVSPGQSVARGQPVAIIVSPDAVRISAEAARTAARAGVASASAHRATVLADEGIIAPARADEAQAIAREARVSASEQARLMAIGSANASGTVTLRAPIGGRVAAINVQPGASLDGMTAPMVIEDSSSVQLDLQLPERWVGRVQIGQRVTLSPGIVGRIVGVGATLDPMTRSVSVRASLSDAQTLVPGQSVQAIIAGGAAPSVGVSVPTSALTRAGDRDAVFVFDGHRMVLRPVQVVARTAERAFISSGLRPGARVATSGVTELRAAGGE